MESSNLRSQKIRTDACFGMSLYVRIIDGIRHILREGSPMVLDVDNSGPEQRLEHNFMSFFDLINTIQH